MDLYSFFTPSPIQILVVLILGVLFFGKNLPEVARQIGLGLMELKKGMNEMNNISRKSKSHSGSSSAAVTATEPIDETEKYESIGTKFEPPSNVV
jgi:sec-independent protein translocase protein TatA